MRFVNVYKATHQQCLAIRHRFHYFDVCLQVFSKTEQSNQADSYMLTDITSKLSWKIFQTHSYPIQNSNKRPRIEYLSNQILTVVNSCP